MLPASTRAFRWGMSCTGVEEQAAPRFPAILIGRVHPPERSRHVVDAHRDEGRQSLHHKRLAGGPHEAAPDEIIKAAHVAPDVGPHPVVTSPLHGTALSVGGRDQQGRCCRYWPTPWRVRSSVTRSGVMEASSVYACIRRLGGDDVVT